MTSKCLLSTKVIYNVCFFSCSTSVLHHLEELKKRELAAKLHNEQLLHQFEEAQDTLRSMLTLSASMRTIRVQRQTEMNKIYKNRDDLKEVKTTSLCFYPLQMEYERYLEYERYPLWQQQLWERRQAALRKVQTKHSTPA